MLTTSGDLAGTGSGIFNAAGTDGLQASTDIIMKDTIVFNVDDFSISQSITSTAGDLDINSASLAIGPAVVLKAGNAVNIGAFSANSDLSIIGGNGVTLEGAASVANSGNLSIDSAPASAVLGATEAVGISWAGAAAGTKHLGAVSHSDGGGLIDLTAVSVDTD